MQVKATLTGAAVLTPSASKHPKRALVTVKLMTWIFEKLDFSNPLDTAVASCFSTIFYSMAHTAEFTLVPSTLRSTSSRWMYSNSKIETT